MKMAEKFNMPIITLIDTPGAYPGIDAEERGQAEAIAVNLREMAILKVPIISYIIGEGASGGALGIGVSDKTFMLENTWYSVISPEGCASILWRDVSNKKEAAKALKLTAADMYRYKLIEGVVKEPLGGAHAYKEEMYQILKDHINSVLPDLIALDSDERVNMRIDKYSNFGEYSISR